MDQENHPLFIDLSSQTKSERATQSEGVRDEQHKDVTKMSSVPHSLHEILFNLRKCAFTSTPVFKAL